MLPNHPNPAYTPTGTPEEQGSRYCHLRINQGRVEGRRACPTCCHKVMGALTNRHGSEWSIRPIVTDWLTGLVMTSYQASVGGSGGWSCVVLLTLRAMHAGAVHRGLTPDVGVAVGRLDGRHLR